MSTVQTWLIAAQFFLLGIAAVATVGYIERQTGQGEARAVKAYADTVNARLVASGGLCVSAEVAAARDRVPHAR